MPRVAIMTFGAALAALPAGCFYVEPINQRPSLDIENLSSAVVHRKDFVNLRAISEDPDGQTIEFSWRAYLCTDASSPVGDEGCDTNPFTTGILDKFAFEVPPVRLESKPGSNGLETLPVESLRVVLEAEDELGATARPSQELIIPVANFAPDLTLTKVSRYGYVDGIAIDLFAKVGDPDDGPTHVQPLAWEIFTPTQPDTYTDTITTLPSDPATPEVRTEKLVLEPHGVGDWKVRVTAIDRLGAMIAKEETITVVADRDPCLAQWQPIAPLDGTARVPIAERTLFRVPVVLDDLDVYPAVPSDPVLGRTRFAWSIRQPGASTFAPLAITGNAVELDPAAYTPDDDVELRVEIYDRKTTAIMCDPDLLTCSTTTQPSCIQRLTWRLEMR